MSLVGQQRAGVVIVGGGLAGYQTAMSLREEGFDGRIRIVSAEAGLPYQRPPLSKGFLSGNVDETLLPYVSAEDLIERDIEYEQGAQVHTIDLRDRSIGTSGGRMAFDTLVLATGARNRRLDREVPHGVHFLRTVNDARALRDHMKTTDRIVIVGGGFLGLEAAVAAAHAGLEVDVIEAMPQLMGRAVSAPMAEVIAAYHRSHSTRLRLGRRVVGFRDIAGRLAAIELDDGTVLPAECALVCIGVVPNVELARDAGLAVADGIRVDRSLSTSIPGIYAIGDCAAFPGGDEGAPLRLESVQNATDQARFVAASIAGKPGIYDAVPWFWTEQGRHRLQIAGHTAGCDDIVLRGDPDAMKLAAYGFRTGRLRAVETLNLPAEHMAARRYLALAAGPSRAALEAADFSLREWMRAPAA